MEGPQLVGVERMGEGLGVGETEGGELGLWIALGGGDEVFPATHNYDRHKSSKTLLCMIPSFQKPHCSAPQVLACGLLGF
jgi:hypothetical protein